MSKGKGLAGRHQLAVQEKVAEKGWAVVFAEGPRGVSTAYTVGLFESEGHPEIAVSGLPQVASAALLGACATRVCQGESFETVEGVSGLIEGYLARFSSLDQKQVVEALPLVGSLSEKAEDIPAVRLWWPDRNGAFPWEAPCEAAAKILQPSSLPRKS